MKILVVNAGSSSLKYQLIETDDSSVLCKGGIERIGAGGFDKPNVSHKGIKGSKEIKVELADHTAAFNVLISLLTDSECGVISSCDEIAAVGHRFVHSGTGSTEPVVLTSDKLDSLIADKDLAPLHMPANVSCVRSCMIAMPGVPNVAVFDTAFHSTMPPKAYMYGVRYEDYEDLHVRKYGFHGASHRFVSAEAIEWLKARNMPCGNIVTCHLGNGSSVSAVKDGKCVDTSMGMTPLEGMLMGTRSGSVDPFVVQYLAGKRGMSLDETLAYLNRKCGFAGICGYSDCRDIYKLVDEGDDKARLVMEMFGYQIRKIIGSYAAGMNGLDAIVFTGGIGENSDRARADICKELDFLGARFDKNKSDTCPRGEISVISEDGSPVTMLVIPTNEEIVIARDTRDAVIGKKVAENN